MKKLSIQTFFRMTPVLLTALFTLFACNKEKGVAVNEFTPTVPTSQIKFEVNEAMNYFNQNARYKGERQDEELLSPIIAGQPEPLWDLATDGMIQTVIGDYAFIEVPLKSQKGTFGMMNWGEEQPLNYARLVITKDKNGMLDGKFMIATPNKAYAQSRLGLSEMRNCAFDRPALDFDGATMYYGLDGKYWKGWSYTNGKQFEEVTQVKKSALQIRDVECSWMSVGYSYTITVGEGINAWSTVHNSTYWVYRCVSTARRDFAPWLWDRMERATTPLPTITTTSLRIILPSERICPNDITASFASNATDGIPSTQKDALLKDFNINFTVNGANITVPMSYVTLTCDKDVTGDELSRFFQARMIETQNLINNGAVSNIVRPAALQSQIRQLFFTQYNSVAMRTFGSTGIASMAYYNQSWRISRFVIPTTCTQ
jgi:hypothetical protein